MIRIGLRDCVRKEEQNPQESQRQERERKKKERSNNPKIRDDDYTRIVSLQREHGTYFSCGPRREFLRRRSQSRSRRRRNAKFTIDCHRGDKKSERGIEFHGGKMEEKERKRERERVVMYVLYDDTEVRRNYVRL